MLVAGPLFFCFRYPARQSSAGGSAGDFLLFLSSVRGDFLPPPDATCTRTSRTAAVGVTCLRFLSFLLLFFSLSLLLAWLLCFFLVLPAVAVLGGVRMDGAERHSHRCTCCSPAVSRSRQDLSRRAPASCRTGVARVPACSRKTSPQANKNHASWFNTTSAVEKRQRHHREFARAGRPPPSRSVTTVFRRWRTTDGHRTLAVPASSIEGSQKKTQTRLADNGSARSQCVVRPAPTGRASSPTHGKR